MGETEVSSSLSVLPPQLPGAGVSVCVEVSDGRGEGKILPALCVGNPEQPKHKMTRCIRNLLRELLPSCTDARMFPYLERRLAQIHQLFISLLNSLRDILDNPLRFP